jgi:hypothetical protein
MDNRQFALDQAVKYFAKGAVTNNVKHVLDTAESFMVFLNSQPVVDNSKESTRVDRPQNPTKVGTTSKS